MGGGRRAGPAGPRRVARRRPRPRRGTTAPRVSQAAPTTHQRQRRWPPPTPALPCPCTLPATRPPTAQIMAGFAVAFHVLFRKDQEHEVGGGGWRGCAWVEGRRTGRARRAARRPPPPEAVLRPAPRLAPACFRPATLASTPRHPRRSLPPSPTPSSPCTAIREVRLALWVEGGAGACGRRTAPPPAGPRAPGWARGAAAPRGARACGASPRPLVSRRCTAVSLSRRPGGPGHHAGQPQPGATAVPAPTRCTWRAPRVPRPRSALPAWAVAVARRRCRRATDRRRPAFHLSTCPQATAVVLDVIWAFVMVRACLGGRAGVECASHTRPMLFKAGPALTPRRPYSTQPHPTQANVILNM